MKVESTAYTNSHRPLWEWATVGDGAVAFRLRPLMHGEGTSVILLPDVVRELAESLLMAARLGAAERAA